MAQEKSLTDIAKSSLAQHQGQEPPVYGTEGHRFESCRARRTDPAQTQRNRRYLREVLHSASPEFLADLCELARSNDSVREDFCRKPVSSDAPRATVKPGTWTLLTTLTPADMANEILRLEGNLTHAEIVLRDWRHWHNGGSFGSEPIAATIQIVGERR